MKNKPRTSGYGTGSSDAGPWYVFAYFCIVIIVSTCLSLMMIKNPQPTINTDQHEIMAIESQLPTGCEFLQLGKYHHQQVNAIICENRQTVTTGSKTTVLSPPAEHEGQD